MKSSSQGYYDEKLSAEKLKRCYDIAPPRVKQYLSTEIDFVISKLEPGLKILELGCGYGRALRPLSGKAKMICGIDTSMSSLHRACSFLTGCSDIYFQLMDAISLGYKNKAFDLVFCIQNGISAFKADRIKLIKEAVRVTKPGGNVLFSSYSEQFWDERLEWFELQAKEGLLGEIDYEKTGDGVIICKDGFKAATIGRREFKILIDQLGFHAQITEVDSSSIFCEIQVS